MSIKEGQGIHARTAYDIEAQALVVKQRQEENQLKIERDKLWFTLQSIDELGKTWYRVCGATMLSTHCDSSLVSALKKGVPYFKIVTSHQEPLIGLGSVSEAAVAAVVVRGGVLYQSPFFDLETFRREHSYYSESVRWLNSASTENAPPTGIVVS